MQWRDRGFITRVERLTKSGMVVHVLTMDHGLHSGYWRGRTLPLVGAVVDVTWRARLEEHMGYWHLEELTSPSLVVTNDPLRLAALMSALTMMHTQIPERAPHRWVVEAFALLYRRLEAADWWVAYGRWEVSVLQALGYGLDLRRCAITGTDQDLILVSPKTGRAVSRLAHDVVAPYMTRMLPLPSYWLQGLSFGGSLDDDSLEASSGASAVTPDEVLAGLVTTGYFLMRALRPRRLPWERDMIVDALRMASTNPHQSILGATAPIQHHG